MSKAVSRRILIAEARLPSQASPRGLCGGESRTGAYPFISHCVYTSQWQQRLTKHLKIRKLWWNPASRPMHWYRRSSLFWDVTQRWLVTSRTFRNDVSVPSSLVKQYICWTLEDVTDRLYRNVGSYQSAMRNRAEGRRHLHCDRRLKTGTVVLVVRHFRIRLQVQFMEAIPLCLSLNKQN